LSNNSPVVSSAEQVRIEGELAQRLADSSSQERSQLYGSVYDRIYEMHLSRDPHTLDFGAGPPALVRFLEKLSHAEEELVEIGCGGGLLAIEMVRRGRRVLGIDVSARILEEARHRAAAATGLTLARTEGTEIPAPDASADFAYSVQVLEHLHPDDVAAHLREVHRVLKPGGRYWLLTPNRLDRLGSSERGGVEVDASHDVHLKEWTYSELVPELSRSGFTSLLSPWRNLSLMWMPLMPVSWFLAAERLPSGILRRRRARSLLGIIACSIVATKPAADG
jgi:SAM-dependent methyltransferase